MIYPFLRIDNSLFDGTPFYYISILIQIVYGSLAYYVILSWLSKLLKEVLNKLKEV